MQNVQQLFHNRMIACLVEDMGHVMACFLCVYGQSHTLVAKETSLTYSSQCEIMKKTMIATKLYSFMTKVRSLIPNGIKH